MRRSLLIGLALMLPAASRAQTAGQLLVQARSAFENLDFEQAARLYTRVLDPAARATIAQRDSAQLYLAVSYQYGGQRENALSAFRTFIRGTPCAPTPDQFGASVTAVFVEARSELFAASLCGLATQRLARGDTAAFRVVVTQPAAVRLLLQDSSGRTVADLGEHQVEGLSVVYWAVGDPGRYPAHPTRHVLVIEGRARQGTATDRRTAEVSLQVPPVDTIATPPPPDRRQFLPERRTKGPALGDLGKGLLMGSGVAAAGALAYGSLKGELKKAVIVGGVVSVTGFAAFIKGTSRLGIPENVERNRRLEAQWRVRRDSVAAENRTRVAGRVLVIAPVEGGP